MADRTCQTIEANNDQRVASGNLAQQLCKSRPSARRAGSMFLNDDVAAGRAQLNLLGFIACSSVETRA